MRKESIATVTRSIPLRRRNRPQARRWTDLVEFIRRFWHEGNRAHELLLDRPWEREGPLRWQRDAGGHKLVGSELALRLSPGDDVER
jgi:hypothetical protein